MNGRGPQVSVDAARGIIRVRFGPAGGGGTSLRRQFLGRLFCCEHVTRVDFHRDPHEAELRVDLPPADAGAVLREIGRVLGEHRCVNVPDDAVARLPVSVRRVGQRVTTWNVVALSEDRICFSHPRLRRDRLVARRCQRLALAQPGVQAAWLRGWGSDLVVRCDPLRFAGDPLLAQLQQEVDVSPAGRGTSAWEMAGTSTTLCVAAAADLAVSALAPVSAVLLVGTNLRTLRTALADLVRWRISMPLVAATIVFGTLATGQFLASGIMAWSFDFWRRRHRRDIEAERQLLIEDAVPIPDAMVAAATGTRHQGLTLDRGGPFPRGSEVPLEPGDVVPADGRISAGGGVVDDRSVSGIAGARGVKTGEFLPAGAVVLGGRFSLITERPLAETRLATIGRILEEATHWRPGRHAPTRQAEEFGEKLAVPTLATAGLGLLAGDIATAVAVMRPDYASAEAISGSFEDLDAVAQGLAVGCLIRSPRSLDRLAVTDTLLLFPYPQLGRGRLEVTRIVRGIPGDHANPVDEIGPQTEAIRFAASLAVHLADERREAMADLATVRGITLLNIAPESYGDADGVRIVGRVGGREIAIHDALPERDGLRPFVFEADSRPVATFEFDRGSTPRAAAVIERLRHELGIRTFAVESDEHATCNGLAAALGCDGVVPAGRQKVGAFVDQLLESGRRVACVGMTSGLMQADGRPHVAIELGGGGGPTSADIVVLATDISRIPDLVLAGRERLRRRSLSRRLTILPNAAFVAGALLLGFTSLVAAVVCNISTLGMYRLATRNLTRDQRPCRLTDRVRSLRSLP